MRKNYIFRGFVLLITTIFLCSGSCERPVEDQYSILLLNKSDQEIVYQGSNVFSMSRDTFCYGTKNLTKMEYEEFIYDFMISPHSSRIIGIDGVIESMKDDPGRSYSLGVFNRIDLDTMSCERFKQIYPLKKEWVLNLDDLLSGNLTLVYTPEE